MRYSIRIAALLAAAAASTLTAQQPLPHAAPRPSQTPAPHAAVIDHGVQHQRAAKPMLDAELSEHFTGIALTEAQVNQVTEIRAKHHAAMDALTQQATDPSDPALKSAMKQHMDAEYAEFTALLTPAQAAQFQANMKAHHTPDGAKHKMKGEMNHDMKHDMKSDTKPAVKPDTKAASAKKP